MDELVRAVNARRVTLKQQLSAWQQVSDWLCCGQRASDGVGFVIAEAVDALMFCFLFVVLCSVVQLSWSAFAKTSRVPTRLLWRVGSAHSLR
jgi:hypothetical protein